MIPAIHGAARWPPIFVRLTAIAAVAAVLILAPVVAPGLDGQQLHMTSVSQSPHTAADVKVTRNDDGENDEEDDDEGDDEDGIDDDDEGDDDEVGDDAEESEDDN